MEGAHPCTLRITGKPNDMRFTSCGRSLACGINLKHECPFVVLYVGRRSVAWLPTLKLKSNMKQLKIIGLHLFPSFFIIYLVIILFFLHIVSFPLANWVRPTHKLTYPVAVDSHEISSTQRKDLLCLWNRILLSTIIKSAFFWHSSWIYQIQISIQIIFQLFQGLNIAPPDQSKGYTMKDIHIMLLFLFFWNLYIHSQF